MCQPTSAGWRLDWSSFGLGLLAAVLSLELWLIGEMIIGHWIDQRLEQRLEQRAGN